MIGLNSVSKFDFCDLPGMLVMLQVGYLQPMVKRVEQHSWDNVRKNSACLCVCTTENKNHFSPKMELLTWHWKVGVGPQPVQEMMWDNKGIDDDKREMSLSPVITPAFASMPKCPIPIYRLCELVHQKRRSLKVIWSKKMLEKDFLLSKDRYEAWDFASPNQFVVNTPSCLLSGFNCENPCMINSTVGLSFRMLQLVSSGLSAKFDKVLVKQKCQDAFLKWLWETAAAEISYHHSYN